MRIFTCPLGPSCFGTSCRRAFFFRRWRRSTRGRRTRRTTSRRCTARGRLSSRRRRTRRARCRRCTTRGRRTCRGRRTRRTRVRRCTTRGGRAPLRRTCCCCSDGSCRQRHWAQGSRFGLRHSPSPCAPTSDCARRVRRGRGGGACRGTGLHGAPTTGVWSRYRGSRRTHWRATPSRVTRLVIPACTSSIRGRRDRR